MQQSGTGSLLPITFDARPLVRGRYTLTLAWPISFLRKMIRQSIPLRAKRIPNQGDQRELFGNVIASVRQLIQCTILSPMLTLTVSMTYTVVSLLCTNQILFSHAALTLNVIISKEI